MILYVVASVVSGILFGILDSLINANPIAKRLYEVYRPIAKTSVNIPAGIIIDLFYGFIMAGMFLILYQSIPGETGLMKGITYGGIIWFFRVVMSVASCWMMYKVPPKTLLYTMVTGLGEMLILGILYGVFLKP